VGCTWPGPGLSCAAAKQQTRQDKGDNTLALGNVNTAGGIDSCINRDGTLGALSVPVVVTALLLPVAVIVVVPVIVTALLLPVAVIVVVPVVVTVVVTVVVAVRVLLVLAVLCG